MKRFMILTTLGLLLISLAIADTIQNTWKQSSAEGLPPTVEKIETCVNTTILVDEPTYTTCTEQVVTQQCNEGNTSCVSTPSQRSYSCQNGTRQLSHIETSCKVTGYLVGDVALNTTNYGCSVTNDGKIYVTCDSVYDGNGDGICTSGESCVRFGIVGNYVVKEVKNSRDDFVADDNSFFLTQPNQATAAEVTE